MKVLVIGSGPIVIGQAAEFDYAGTQACKSLKEEGHEVVLINSNPATIMTDPGVADALYIEPLNVDFCERVIARERPDALLPTLGGQTGLNLATQLSDQGILEKYNVKLLGTPLSAIRKAEDREQFRDLMREIKEPVPESWIIESPQDLEAVLDVVPYPCIIRPAYTLGGTGGGVANTKDELWEIGNKGLKLSLRSQIMVERSLLGWKEVEYEVMRDKAGNCITVCNMENFDPMGVHTGDSIVIAPSQTLSDIEYHMLRTASLKIIQSLGIEGGCNVQLAVNPESFDYYIIEVNPRVSRSSALASKATGYPIARVAAKIAVGKTLDEIENQVTGTTKACFEPALDYCVVKIPRWPFDKFATGDRSLFTQMKATGEVMAIDRTFESAFMKAIRGLEVKQKDLRHAKFQGGMPDQQLAEAIRKPTDERLWAIAEGLRRDWTIEEVNKLSRVDKWFLRKIQYLLDVEQSLVKASVRSMDSTSIWRAADVRPDLKRIPETRIPQMSDGEILDVLSRQDVKEMSEAERGWAVSALLARGIEPAVLAPLSRLSQVEIERMQVQIEYWKDRADLHKNQAAAKSPQQILLAHLIREAFLIGYPSHSILDLLGVDRTVLRLARKLLEGYETLVDKEPNLFGLHELTDLLQDNPYELPESATEERARFSAGHLQAARLYEKLFEAFWGEPFGWDGVSPILGHPRANSKGVPYNAIVAIADEIERQKVMPVFKMVDTCAGEFESQTPYYYGTFEDEDDAAVMT